MVSGPPTTATASALMPTSAQITAGNACTTVTSANAPANSLPSSAPRNSEAKNSPPRKPEPMDTAEATAFSMISSAMCSMLYGASSEIRSAAWPDDMTAGVASARQPTTNPPSAGRSQVGTPLVRNRPSPISRNLPLAAAAFKGDADVVRLLLERGASVDGRGEGGRTALMVAAMFDRAEIVELLLARGADPHVLDGGGLTARDAAERMAETTGDRSLLELTQAVERTTVKVLADLKPGRDLYANVELYAALILHAVGVPSELFTPVFAVGRTSGWTAHMIEQLEDNRLIRPSSIYVGPRDLKWVPIDQRT